MHVTLTVVNFEADTFEGTFWLVTQYESIINENFAICIYWRCIVILHQDTQIKQCVDNYVPNSEMFFKFHLIPGTLAIGHLGKTDIKKSCMIACSYVIISNGNNDYCCFFFNSQPDDVLLAWLKNWSGLS